MVVRDAFDWGGEPGCEGGGGCGDLWQPRVSQTWVPKFRKIPAPIKIKLAVPPPTLLKRPRTTPLKRRSFMGMGVFQQKEPTIPGAQKIGAAISGPRIAGGKFCGHEVFFPDTCKMMSALQTSNT